MSGENDAAVRTFTCPHCGATQQFDPATRTLSCPFCGTNLELDAAPAAPVDSVPAEMRGIVPFAIGREDALARLRAWLGKGFWSPSDLASRAAVDVTDGVYVPHYGFVLDVHANWTGAYAQTHHRTEVYTTTDANGNKQVQSRDVPYTVWYPESGQHDGTHSTLVCASQGLTQAEADALLPFDLDAARPDQSDFLAGFSTELPHIPVEEGWRSAGNARIEGQVRAACAAMTGQLRTYNWVTERSQEALVWLPVWIYRYRYQERSHRVVMNGQTGKMAGERPVSRRKVGIAVLVPLVALIILIATVSVRSAQATATKATANAIVAATETARPTALPLPYMQTSEAGRMTAEARQRDVIATIQASNTLPAPTATPPRTPTPIATASPSPTATADAFRTAIAQPPTAARATVVPTPSSTPNGTAPPTPPASTDLRAYTDAQGRFTCQYPVAWRATPGTDPEVVTFATPDGLHVSVSLFSSGRSPAEQLQVIHNSRPPTRVYTDGAIQAAQLPGGAAATMRYRSVAATNSADVHDGVFWDIATGGGTLIQIEAYADGALTPAQQDAVAAMARSVTFR